MSGAILDAKRALPAHARYSSIRPTSTGYIAMTHRKHADDGELFATMRTKLFTAVIGDILDALGYLHQFLPPNIRPLRDDMVAIGRAMPVLEADFFMRADENGQGEFSAKPFGL